MLVNRIPRRRIILLSLLSAALAAMASAASLADIGVYENAIMPGACLVFALLAFRRIAPSITHAKV